CVRDPTSRSPSRSCAGGSAGPGSPNDPGVRGALVRWRASPLPVSGGGLSSRPMSPRSALVALAVLSTGCGEDSGPAVDGSARSAARSPAPGAVLTHDFGTIPHGETRTVELSVPLPDTDLGWAPVRLLKTCSCARHEFVIRGAGGDRIADERPTTLV